MERRTALAIMGGGAIGALCRWSASELTGPTNGWPWGVFTANLIGCAALGWLVARRGVLPSHWFAAAAIGFCGALTTFSAFAVDIGLMARDDRLVLLVAYLAISLTAGIAVYAVGHRLGQDPATQHSTAR